MTPGGFQRVNALPNETITTIAATIAAGVCGLSLSQKTAIPSIIFFLVFGIALGPEYAGLVNPSVFRDNFPHYISLMVSLILFEGGATLKLSQYRHISRTVRRLLAVGSTVTLAGVAAGAHFLAGLNWKQSILLGGVLIVTGPTVVVPILQRLRVRDNVHNVLKWESILIDPVGVVTAVVIFEVFILQSEHWASGVLAFFVRFAAGALIGIIGGWLIEQLLTRSRLFRLEGEELASLIVVAGVVLLYGCAEAVSSHAGLVATTTLGVFLGNRRFAYKDHVMRFEQTLTLFALSVLFIWLSSQVPLPLLKEVAGPGLALLAVMIFLVRPAAVFLSADASLSTKEKAFVAGFAPRGIVSASLASLFSLHLVELGGAGNQFLALSFFLIVGSIVFYTLTGALSARLLDVREAEPTGIMIVGATPLALAMANALRQRGRLVQFIDTNAARCEEARNLRFDAFDGSGFDLEFIESLDRKGVGFMAAMTPSHEVNLLACQAFTNLLGPGRAYRLWDRSDSWESVTSLSYDQSMGKPILATYFQAAETAWAFDMDRSVHVITRTQETNGRVTPEVAAAFAADRPLFAWGKGLVFITPESTVDAGAEIVCVQPAAKPTMSNTVAGAKRAFERIRKLYGKK